MYQNFTHVLLLFDICAKLFFSASESTGVRQLSKRLKGYGSQKNLNSLKDLLIAQWDFFCSFRWGNPNNLMENTSLDRGRNCIPLVDNLFWKVHCRSRWDSDYTGGFQVTQTRNTSFWSVITVFRPAKPQESDLKEQKPFDRPSPWKNNALYSVLTQQREATAKKMSNCNQMGILLERHI